MNEQNLTLIRRLGQVIEELTRIHDELASQEPEPEVEPAAMPEKFDKDHPYDPALFGWVDLGLPSGRLWADRPAPGYYQYDQAVEAFGEDLPKGVAMAELCEECEWTWDKERKGYDVVGKNGNRIFISALGYQDYDSATGELISGALGIVGSDGFLVDVLAGQPGGRAELVLLRVRRQSAEHDQPILRLRRASLSRIIS